VGVVEKKCIEIERAFDIHEERNSTAVRKAVIFAVFISVAILPDKRDSPGDRYLDRVIESHDQTHVIGDRESVEGRAF
jgi:hypothetical protein